MRILQFYGINFCEANYNLIIELLIKKKGYIVMPAASALVNIKNVSLYHKRQAPLHASFPTWSDAQRLCALNLPQLIRLV